VEKNRPLRHAMEIRHPSFVTPEFIHVLRCYEIALVCADTATPARAKSARAGEPESVSWPRLMDVTADFVYCRLHGSEQLYASGYDGKSLDEWAARVAAWARGSDAPGGEFASREPAPRRAGRDVYVYFDNDAKVRAPADAEGLIERGPSAARAAIACGELAVARTQRIVNSALIRVELVQGPILHS